MANREYIVTLSNGREHRVRANTFSYYGSSGGIQFYREVPYTHPDPEDHPGAMDQVSVAMFSNVESVVIADDVVEE